MSQSVKRVFNAFVIGFLGSVLILALEHWLDITAAVQVSDWVSLKQLGLSVLMGAVFGGLRALQAFTPVPSPEPEENDPNFPPAATRARRK